MTYEKAVKSFNKSGQDKVASSWKDSLVSGRFNTMSEYLKIPKDCFIDRRKWE
jgi:hypothetical protein